MTTLKLPLFNTVKQKNDQKINYYWKRIIYRQLIITFLAMGAVYILTREGVSALSVFLGGISCIIPFWVFASYYFNNKNIKSGAILKSLYIGVILKIIVSGVLFAFVFIFFPINGAYFFITFILAQFIMWFGSRRISFTII